MTMDEKEGGKTLKLALLKPAFLWGQANKTIHKNLLVWQSQDPREYLRKLKPLSKFDPD